MPTRESALPARLSPELTPLAAGGSLPRPTSRSSADSHAPTDDAHAQLRAVKWAVAMIGIVALYGIIGRLVILHTALGRPQSMNVFFRLYEIYELPYLLLTGLTALAMVLVLLRRTHDESDTRSLVDRLPMPSTRWLALLGALVFVLAWLIPSLVFHGHNLSMDEFTSDFQARIFATGSREAPFAALWRPFEVAMTPVFVKVNDAHTGWESTYLPGYALLKTPFVMAGAERLLNPLLAALSIVLVGAIARRLWPQDKLRPWVAVGVLATSSEFILTSGTSYSMPAHLCLNLLWLWLYLRDDALSWGAALVVGVLALGLHNPFPHALFVAPFLLRLLLDRRWTRLGAAAVVYGAGSLLWYTWLRSSYAPIVHDQGMLGMFAMPNGVVLWLQGLNISLLFTWQTPLLGLLAAAALFRMRRMEPVMRDVTAGLLLTLAFYAFFPFTQGHGWGNRYAYQVLGNVALIAAVGVGPLVTVFGQRRAELMLACSLAVAVVVQVPARLIDAEHFARPYAAGAAYLASRPADVVIVHNDSIWYGRDLVRNDPFLHHPVIMMAAGLDAEQRAALHAKFPGRVVEVTNSELLKLGMTPWIRRRF